MIFLWRTTHKSYCSQHEKDPMTVGELELIDISRGKVEECMKDLDEHMHEEETEN